MPYTIGFLDDEGIVRIENTGNLKYKECLKQIQEAMELGRIHHTHLYFADCANLVVQANIVEVFDFFPGIYEKSNVPKTVKLACLISEDAATAKEMVFYETICRNRGWQIRLFKDRNAAMQWLHGQQEA